MRRAPIAGCAGEWMWMCNTMWRSFSAPPAILRWNICPAISGCPLADSDNQLIRKKKSEQEVESRSPCTFILHYGRGYLCNSSISFCTSSAKDFSTLIRCSTCLQACSTVAWFRFNLIPILVEESCVSFLAKYISS